MKSDKEYINKPICVIIALAAVLTLAVIVMATYVATVEREKWTKLGEVSVGRPEPLPAARGNIMSADGQLMASSLPDYKVYVDLLGHRANERLHCSRREESQSMECQAAT